MFISSVQCTIVLVIINIVAIVAFESQARSHVIKLHNCLNSFSTTLYVHIFGSVHASFDSVKQYQLIPHNSLSHYQHCSDLWPLKVKRDRI